LCAGTAVIFLSSISPQRIIEAFHKHKITCFICVPQFFYVLHKRIFGEVATQNALVRRVFQLTFALAKRVRSRGFRRRLFSRIHRSVGPDLWLFASGGSRFDEKIAEDLSVLGYTVLQAYGLTETSAAATATLASENALGTVGKPIRGVSVRVDSADSKGIGEVWISGPIVMTGYYRDADMTRAVMPDGWLKTGDLGYIRSDGNLVITGRSKDVIVLPNGKNVYPEELETHYGQTPYIKELCIMGLPESDGGPAGEKLHAVIVPDLEEFRRRNQSGILEMIRFDLETLSKQVPAYQRILSLSIRNEPLPRTVTRKLKRFEIQEEEIRRLQSPDRTASKAIEDHPRLKTGLGAALAQLIRDAKPDAGPLDLTTNLELDLAFDSLARVELFGTAEAKLGASIGEQEAPQIFTIGDFLDVLSRSRDAAVVRGTNWKEILDEGSSPEFARLPVFQRWFATDLVAYLAIKAYKVLVHIFFGLKYGGLEKLPRTRPYLLCPNHESFLDGPTLISTLPRAVIDDIFIVGQSEYWESFISRWIARFCKIVSIDANANLVRAMQIGAAGLKRNRVLLIFPEGTRSIDGRVAEFKKGAAILAFELNTPVVPVGIRGTFEAWPRAGSFKFHPLEIVFGDPIDPGSLMNSADPYGALTDKLREEVRVLSADSG
jgi:long-chain acyl-CoA synthetase